MSLRSTIPLLATLVLLAACNTPEPASPSVGLTLPVDPPQPPDVGNYIDRGITIHVYTSENLRRYCVGPDPFFHYDSDRITPQDQPGLYALAACLKTGPLQGKRLELTGRADPRGSAAVNEKVGLERAERVKQFLVDQGVAPDRLVAVSAGKTGAHAAPDKWRTDRRVDMEILP